jgi:hypothetical protein
MRSVALCAIALMCLAEPAAAQTRVVAGQFGMLGHWAGPVHMRHVGYCTVDGPEEKNGDLQLSLAEPRGPIKGSIVIDGVTCGFNARLKDAYEGTLRCPDRRAMPIAFSVY